MAEKDAVEVKGVWEAEIKFDLIVQYVLVYIKFKAHKFLNSGNML